MIISPMESVFVVENEQGGGEVGYQWLKENLPKSFFEAGKEMVMVRLPSANRNDFPRWLQTRVKDIVACSHLAIGTNLDMDDESVITVRLEDGGLLLYTEYRSRRLYYVNWVTSLVDEWKKLLHGAMMISLALLQSRPTYAPQVCDKSLMDRLVLPSGMKEDIIEDSKMFLGGPEVYSELGVPWKRGYMFIGSPGNGKTLFIRALASYWRLGMIDLSSCIDQSGNVHVGAEIFDPSIIGKIRRAISDPKELLGNSPPSDDEIEIWDRPGCLEEVMSKDIMSALLKASSIVPRPSIYVLEDIDKFVTFQSGQGKHKDAGIVSLHALLKALDGIQEVHAAMVIATTNYIDELSEALINRPGRFDRIWEFPKPTEEGLVAFFRNRKVDFKGISFEEVAKEMEGLSMAFAEELVKTLLVMHRRREFDAKEVKTVLERIKKHEKLAADRFGRRITGLSAK